MAYVKETKKVTLEKFGWLMDFQDYGYSLHMFKWRIERI